MGENESEEALRRADHHANKGHWKDALIEYQKLADAGNAHAMARLGWAYSTGSGVELNTEQAEHWYRKAAASKNLWAQYQASLFLAQNGQDKAAFSLVDELAHKGYLPAIYRLSKFHAVGTGTEKNLDLSIYYRDYAATHGHVWALREQAVAMMKGSEGPQKIIPGFFAFVALLPRTYQLGTEDKLDVRLIR